MRAAIGRISALVLQEAYMTKHSLELFFDIFFFPMMNVVLFGLITSFVAGTSGSYKADYLIVGILLWEVVTINQYNVTVSSLWTLWSHNLTNIFIAPVSIFEYLLSHMIAALVRTVLVTGLLAVGTDLAFRFNLLSVGWPNLLWFGINLSLFGWWIGIILLGLIFRFGTRIQAMSWGLIFLFQPLTAAFFPVQVLPKVLQSLAYWLPATYVFEGARRALGNGRVDLHGELVALGLNVIYFAIAIWIFAWLFRGSRRSGQFARNDL